MCAASNSNQTPLLADFNNLQRKHARSGTLCSSAYWMKGHYSPRNIFHPNFRTSYISELFTKFHFVVFNIFFSSQKDLFSLKSHTLKHLTTTEGGGPGWARLYSLRSSGVRQTDGSLRNCRGWCSAIPMTSGSVLAATASL